MNVKRMREDGIAGELPDFCVVQRNSVINRIQIKKMMIENKGVGSKNIRNAGTVGECNYSCKIRG